MYRLCWKQIFWCGVTILRHDKTDVFQRNKYVLLHKYQLINFFLKFDMHWRSNPNIFVHLYEKQYTNIRLKLGLVIND